MVGGLTKKNYKSMSKKAGLFLTLFILLALLWPEFQVRTYGCNPERGTELQITCYSPNYKKPTMFGGLLAAARLGDTTAYYYKDHNYYAQIPTQGFLGDTNTPDRYFNARRAVVDSFLLSIIVFLLMSRRQPQKRSKKSVSSKVK